MASHFIEQTGLPSRPAFIHLNTSLLMVMKFARSGYPNVLVSPIGQPLLVPPPPTPVLVK